VSCHNGTIATGKTPTHVASSDNCDACHTTTAWKPANFDHSTVVAGTCAQCHDGTKATGKTVNHIPTTQSCDVCHSTIAWKPAKFSHTGVTPGTCSTCHDGTKATGKGAGHWTTARECDVCHTTTVWSPIISPFRHTSPNYPGDHRVALTCVSCHTTRADTVPYRTPSYAPACAACHAANYKPDPHTKINGTNTKYTVSELRNCSGACHIYTNSTLTTISRSRPGPQHRVTNTSFN
jgi:cytochrome c553